MKRKDIGPFKIMGGIDKYELITVSITREYISLSLLGAWVSVMW